MIRSVHALILASALMGRGSAAEQNQLDANQTLFAVLCAINAGGYDSGIDSPNNSPVRAQVRQYLAGRKIPVLPEIQEYYKKHPGLNPYLSLALSVAGPPDFAFKMRAVEISPDASALAGFLPLLATFYTEANIEELWRKSQPAFDQAIERYHAPVSQAILQVNSYLRNPTAGYLGRRFQIYIDLLAAPNQVQSRSLADDYYVIATPSPEPRINDIRHAYLHFLLDPLNVKYGEELLKKRALGDYAQGAPSLEESYKSDFVLLATESLIKAIESRLSPDPKVVDAALHEGYILTPFYAEQLPLYEKQPQAMRLYFPEMVKAIDSRRENKRLEKVEFVAAAQGKAVKQQSAPEARAAVPASTAARTIETAENLYGARDLEKARLLFLRSLQESGEASDHARAYYGLARIAVLQKDPELGERLFQKALESSPDAQVKAWTLVYLGRLSGSSGDREQAVKHYQQALAVNGASPMARQAAEKGLQESKP